MTLIELIEELQRLRTRVNDNIEVKVCVYETRTREDFATDQIESVEENEDEYDKKIVCISLKNAFQSYP